ncbi:MAG: DinB family protein [Bacteroidetes bacterium]|nr:DinB family protein [Bacteroidota bacterium]
MTTRTNWVDRKFGFGLDNGLFPNIIERLRGTPARIKALVEALPEDLLTQRDGEKWSIKEHIGHLGDLEELHEGRIDDFIAVQDRLRPADMENRKTYEADHNEKGLVELIGDFNKARTIFVGRLESLEEPILESVAMHPRLDEEMRIVDMAHFTAEHDDHHLASITMLIRKYG